MVAYSSYYYNAVNTESQDAYSLVNFRAGVHGEGWKAEAWVKNAFDTEYIPIALEYGAGRIVGESGAPRTFGIRVWMDF
jgi:iron complex outermembrane receptor protein